jgi:Methyl-accepting chemotaxis protein
MKTKHYMLLFYLILSILAFAAGGASAFLYQTTIVLPVILLVVILVLAVILAVVGARSIAKPIGNVVIAAKHMADGDLNDVLGRAKGEFGELTDAMNQSIASQKAYITEISSILNSIADGNLNVEVDRKFTGDYVPVKEALDKIVTVLNSSMKSIHRSSAEVSNGSEQVSNASQALAQGATEQASAIQELSATITEISEQVKQNASDASEANRASGDAQAKIQDVSDEMRQMLQAMTDITESSNKINNIIKTIDEIARQTNILALNAAVEAARAGAAGKGFAVVADEVRNLASKSAEAAQNTTGLIENSIEAVEKGKTIADKTAKTLGDVIEANTKSTELINRIASASNLQADAIGQVTLGVEQISAVVQTNSATAEQSAASSQEMAEHAKLLQSLVNRFSFKIA